MICDPSFGLAVVFGISWLSILLGSVMGYSYRSSVFSLFIGGGIALAVMAFLLPYLLGAFGWECVIK